MGVTGVEGIFRESAAQTLVGLPSPEGVQLAACTILCLVSSKLCSELVAFRHVRGTLSWLGL
eukprot:1445801-Amphidinium_carterae.1